MNNWYKGWFLFAPVYINMDDPECPAIEARLECMEWLVSCAAWCQESMIGFLSLCNPDYEPAFMLRLAGEIDPPR